MATNPASRTALTPQKRPSRRLSVSSLTLFPTAAPNGIREFRGASSPPPAIGRSSKPAEELVGIARLAASSPLADAKGGTEYFVLPVRSILNHCDSPRLPFNWTVNPYRGCEFGCRYCYARYTHEFMELDGADFERKIYVKKDAGALMARDLECKNVGSEHIAIGAATDPYQPAEGEYGVTRGVLEKIAEREGMSISITTKSDRVIRDIELLKRISARSSLTINLSVTTLRTRLARLLEPRAPRPDLRVAAVRRLTEAGLAAGVFVMPILPGITDRAEDLDALARAARDAGARWFAGNVLFLMPASFRQFLPFIEAQFPKLAGRYREWYLHKGNAPEAYRSEMTARIRDLRKKYGLGSRPESGRESSTQSRQLNLNLGNAVWPYVEQIKAR